MKLIFIELIVHSRTLDEFRRLPIACTLSIRLTHRCMVVHLDRHIVCIVQRHHPYIMVNASSQDFKGAHHPWVIGIPNAALNVMLGTSSSHDANNRISDMKRLDLPESIWIMIISSSERWVVTSVASSSLGMRDWWRMDTPTSNQEWDIRIKRSTYRPPA